MKCSYLDNSLKSKRVNIWWQRARVPLDRLALVSILSPHSGYYHMRVIIIATT